MIPKIIHFCWFGGNSLPNLALECIASWRKYLPDYEIWMWREDPQIHPLGGMSVADKVMGFDVNSIPYTKEAYKQKKYAYVSDYARFVIMYLYGGVYFDTDVEVIKPIDDILNNNDRENINQHYGFMGFEQDPDGMNTYGKYAPRYCFGVNPGLCFGMTKGHSFMKRMVDYYQSLEFQPVPEDIAWYKTIVAYTTEELMKDEPPLTPPKEAKSVMCWFRPRKYTDIQVVGDGIHIYPSDFFAPINVMTGRLHITENTRTIHRYMGSWGTGRCGIKERIKRFVPEWVFFINNRLKRQRYRIK